MKRVLAIFGTLLLLAAGAALTASAANSIKGEAARPMEDKVAATGFTVSQSVKNDTSRPIRDIPGRPLREGPERAISAAREVNPPLNTDRSFGGVDTVVQRVFGALAMPTPLVSFDGVRNYWGFYPPDTVGDVGPYNYVQMVNVGLQVSDKLGNVLMGPVANNIVWSDFGGPCEAENAGDPIVLYDPLADRWLLSQFTSNAPPYYQCVAISATGDPTGSYHRYAFQSTNPTYFPDYPKFGVWPDAYYNSVNEFPDAGGFFVGTYAFERSQMLTGAAARALYFRLTSPVRGMLPSDVDGTTPPPAGAPNLFTYFRDNNRGDTADELPVWAFHADWATPSNSSMTLLTTLPTAPFDSTPPQIPQPGTSVVLDTLSDRLMFRFAYRNMGTTENWVVNHSVELTSTTGPSYIGVRWYEIKRTGGISGTLSINQQGTYAPDQTNRWMGSIAMDKVGNIAVGYSVSSSTITPSIRYAGRLATDPLGTLGQGETDLISGTGVQVGTANRWGDYSAMSVDPSDDCTFWYTTEYYVRTSTVGWRTRIGSFKFPNCVGATPTPTQTPCAITFTDVHPSDYFYVPVEYMFCHGIISGYEDNTFRPFNSTTRSQMVKIVVLGFNIPLSTNQTPLFNDVPTSNPFFVFVQTAAEHQIVSGYACGGPGEPCPGAYFRPFNLVTRGQLSKIVVVAAEWDLINPITQTFSDVPSTDPFYTFIETAYCHQIISGYADGTFKPGANATRGQISKIVYLAITDTSFCGQSTPTPTMTPCPMEVITGTITLSDPVQNGRLNYYNGQPASTCAAPQLAPGPPNLAVQRHYDVYSYTNTSGSAQCITVWFDGRSCVDNAVYSVAYSPVFSPTSITTNYLASGGEPGPTGSYSFNVPAGASYQIVVHELINDLGCAQYTLRVGTCGGVATSTPAPPTLTSTSTPVPPTNTATRTNTPGGPTSTPTPSGSCTYTFSTATATPYANVTNDTGNSCDDCASIISLPFPVQFYGATYNSVQAYSNGYLEFSAQAQTFAWDGCLPLDTGGQDPPFEQAAFIFNDDLRTDTAACADCGIYTATFGTAPNRVFVVRWHTTYFADETMETNFQAVLTEGSGVISAIYGATGDSGAGAVVGTQFDVTRFAEFQCDQATLTSGLRVNFTPSGCALRPKPKP